MEKQKLLLTAEADDRELPPLYDCSSGASDLCADLCSDGTGIQY